MHTWPRCCERNSRASLTPSPAPGLPHSSAQDVDEDGCVRVHSSTQNTDASVIKVAALLNLTHNQVR